MRKLLRATVPIALFLWAASCVPAACAPDWPLGGSFTLLGDSPHQLDVGLGAYGLRHNTDSESQAARLELRIGRKIAYIGPAVGLLANRERIRYLYTGLYAELAWRRFVLTPQLGIGIFRNGSGIDLGGPLEFRESVEVAYRLTDRWRIGVSAAHVSNADIYRENPGQQDFLINCSVGF
jgi:lipid A 3-O-deacylase